MRNLKAPTVIVAPSVRPANWPNTAPFLAMRVRTMLLPTDGLAKPAPSVRFNVALPRLIVPLTVRAPKFPVLKALIRAPSELLLDRVKAEIVSLNAPRFRVAPVRFRALAAAIWLLAESANVPLVRGT